MKNIFKNRRNLKKVLILIFLANLILISGVVLARVAPHSGERCNEIDWPHSPLGTSINPTWQEIEKGHWVCRLEGGIPKLVKYFYEWGITLGGIAAFIALLMAGFQYLTSVGDPGAMRAAMDRIKMAGIGLVLLLSSWLILNKINPELTSFPELSFKPNVPSTTIECKNDDDCVKAFKNENCKCYIPKGKTKGKTTGSCLCIEPEAPVCTKVILYGKPNFRDPKITLEASEEEGSECKNLTVGAWILWPVWHWQKGYYPQSSKGYFKYGGKELEDGKCYIFKKETGELIDSKPKDDCLGAKIQEDEICRCMKCRGTMQFFAKSNCEDMRTELPVTNRIICLEDVIRSTKLFIEAPTKK